MESTQLKVSDQKMYEELCKTKEAVFNALRTARRRLDVRQCPHSGKESDKYVSGHACIMSMFEKSSKYIVGTQEASLKVKLRRIPGSPLLHISNSVLLLEQPSDATLAEARRVSPHMDFISFNIDPKSSLYRNICRLNWQRQCLKHSKRLKRRSRLQQSQLPGNGANPKDPIHCHVSRQKSRKPNNINRDIKLYDSEQTMINTLDGLETVPKKWKEERSKNQFAKWTVVAKVIF